MTKYGKVAQETMREAAHKFGHGELKSGKGGRVKS